MLTLVLILEFLTVVNRKLFHSVKTTNHYACWLNISSVNFFFQKPSKFKSTSRLLWAVKQRVWNILAAQEWPAASQLRDFASFRLSLHRSQSSFKCLSSFQHNGRWRHILMCLYFRHSKFTQERSQNDCIRAVTEILSRPWFAQDIRLWNTTQELQLAFN